MGDTSDKSSQDKHLKYYDFYENFKNTKDKEYWGIGIENESYLMFQELITVKKEFIQNNHKRERYSVNYWANFKEDILKKTLDNLPENVSIPVYVNGYLFQKTDVYGEPIKLYTKNSEPNPKFSGETIDEYLIRKSLIYNKLFDKNMIFDGDTFEFTTYDFYKTNVKNVVKELMTVKKNFLDEVNHHLFINKKGKKHLFTEKLIFPKFNYGFAKFLTNPNNVAICNNGTYHINITLPTELNEKEQIKNPEHFKVIHGNAIRAIQWFEPFLVALYGSPDILHLLNKDYAGGSLRLMMSRYIGLGIYNEKEMRKGKLLNDFDYKNKNHYFEKLHKNSPYNPPETIGYDFNYNKFLKHGIELRIFDYFPEEYLEDIINFIILLCQYSIDFEMPDPKEDEDWQQFVIDIIKNGSNVLVPINLKIKINKVFNTTNNSAFSFLLRKQHPVSILHFMNKIGIKLFDKYGEGPIVKKLSPNMKIIHFVDFNKMVKEKFSELIIITV